MKRRIFSDGLAVVLVMTVLVSTGLGSGLLSAAADASAATEPQQVAPVPDLDSLLNYPYQALIQDLAGAQADQVVAAVLARPEAVRLKMALAEGGYWLDMSAATAMRVTLNNGAGTVRVVDVAILPAVPSKVIFLPVILRQYAGPALHVAPTEWTDEVRQQPPAANSTVYFVGMVADDGTGFFQAHKTNLDPALAALPDAPVVVNGSPYLYITTLHVTAGRIAYWHYWWYDANHHPNWYYAYYLHYWDYYLYHGYAWSWWYHWVYGWYYWRFWYYWSAWFPW